MTDLIGGVLMVLGGGMLSATSIRLNQPTRSAWASDLVETLGATPAPADTPADMLELLGRLTHD